MLTWPKSQGWAVDLHRIRFKDTVKVTSCVVWFLFLFFFPPLALWSTSLSFSQLWGWIKELHGCRWAGETFWYQQRCRHSKRNFWMFHLLGISVPGFSVWHDTAIPRCCSEESWTAPAHTESSICTRHESTKHLYLGLLSFLTWNLQLDRPFHYSSFTLLLEEYNLSSYLHCQGGFKWEVRIRPSIFWWFLCVLMTDEQLEMQ